MEIDNLQKLYDLQLALLSRYRDKGYILEFPLDLSSKEGVKVFRDCVFHITQELFEAVTHLKTDHREKKKLKIMMKLHFLKK